MRKNPEDQAWGTEPGRASSYRASLRPPLLPQRCRIAHHAEVVHREHLLRGIPPELFAANAHIRTVPPELDVRPIAMDDHLSVRPMYLLRLGVVNLVIAVEIDESYRHQHILGVLQVEAYGVELPIRNELVAVEMDAPVPSSGSARGVVETDTPIETLRCFPA